MVFNSPLRYPGGKNKLAGFIESICKENDVTGHYIEPYAGGASVALHLLFNGHVEKVTINDRDRSVYAFWNSVLCQTEKFCGMIENTNVDVENWKIQKNMQRDKSNLFDLGFSTFFLNRTNHSGILSGGIIGGLNQSGKYKINCRFNKKTLIHRIERIAEHKDNITLTGIDAKDLVERMRRRKCKNTIFYFDPPYFVRGPSLYMNHYTKDDHSIMANKIKKIKNAVWIVSYDDAPEIRKIYKGCRKMVYPVAYTARDIRYQSEILFFSDDVAIPSNANGKYSRHPDVYTGRIKFPITYR